MASAACAIQVRPYQRREPEKTLLYQVVAGQLATFLEQTRGDNTGLPRHVEKEFERYLACAILAHGFAHFHCDQCGAGLAVPFSCKTRGFCPSCLGRRMADIAACLVDQVLPDVPVRQWVLSLPIQLRWRLAYDKQLTSARQRSEIVPKPAPVVAAVPAKEPAEADTPQKKLRRISWAQLLKRVFDVEVRCHVRRGPGRGLHRARGTGWRSGLASC